MGRRDGDSLSQINNKQNGCFCGNQNMLGQLVPINQTGRLSNLIRMFLPSNHFGKCGNWFRKLEDLGTFSTK